MKLVHFFIFRPVSLLAVLGILLTVSPVSTAASSSAGVEELEHACYPREAASPELIRVDVVARGKKKRLFALVHLFHVKSGTVRTHEVRVERGIDELDTITGYTGKRFSLLGNEPEFELDETNEIVIEPVPDPEYYVNFILNYRLRGKTYTGGLECFEDFEEE